MKRYALFCGDHYYPSGGWGDFYGSYDSVGAAKEALKLDFKREPDWWEIIDLQTGGEAEVKDQS